MALVAHAPSAKKFPSLGRFAIPLVFLLAVSLAATNYWHDRLFHHSGEAGSGDSGKAAGPDKPKVDLTRTVILPEGKFKLAELTTERVAKTQLPTEVIVTGQVTANPDRFLDIHPRVTGVIRSVFGEVGGHVRKGDLLAIIDSNEVGKARLDLRARQRELATARAEADWKREVSRNVEEMIPLLRKNTPAKEIAGKFTGKSLGSFRADLLGGYSDLEIARHEEEKQTDLFKKEIVGEHPYFLAIHTREGRQAKFEAELEQARFDSAQQLKVANLAVRNGEAAVVDAAQRLRLLGVTEDLAELLATDSTSAQTTSGEFEDVTKYVVTAPFDGTILDRTAAMSQRVDVTDILFTIVDATEVRIQANFPESELKLLPQLKSAKLQVTAAAYPGKTFEAKVVGIGSQVHPENRSVPLRASLPNPDGLLKIGMFVRIVIDSSASEECLTVPASSVVEIEEKTGVFLPDADPRTFHFHPVKIGREVDGKVVIRGGLAEKEQIIGKGAFLLKSELILQNESEEE